MALRWLFVLFQVVSLFSLVSLWRDHSRSFFSRMSYSRLRLIKEVVLLAVRGFFLSCLGALRACFSLVSLGRIDPRSRISHCLVALLHSCPHEMTYHT